MTLSDIHDELAKLRAPLNEFEERERDAALIDRLMSSLIGESSAEAVMELVQTVYTGRNREIRTANAIMGGIDARNEVEAARRQVMAR